MISFILKKILPIWLVLTGDALAHKTEVVVDEALLPCGAGFEKFVPAASLGYVEKTLAQDCVGLGLVTPFYTRANAEVNAAEYCVTLNQPCKSEIGFLEPPPGLETLTLDAVEYDVILVQEGGYRIASNEETMATGRISNCVAIALTGNGADNYFLGHINGENIIAHDADAKEISKLLEITRILRLRQRSQDFVFI